MVKALDCGIVVKRVRTLVALLHSFSNEYLGKGKKPLILLALALLEGWLWH